MNSQSFHVLKNVNGASKFSIETNIKGSYHSNWLNLSFINLAMFAYMYVYSSDTIYDFWFQDIVFKF